MVPNCNRNVKSNMYYGCQQTPDSSSSFGCGAGDHKIPPTAAIFGQRRNIVWLQHSIRISQEVLNTFQVQRAWPSWLSLSMRWNIQCIFFHRFILIASSQMYLLHKIIILRYPLFLHYIMIASR